MNGIELPVCEERHVDDEVVSDSTELKKDVHEDVVHMSDMSDSKPPRKPQSKTSMKRKEKAEKKLTCPVCGHQCNTLGALISHKRIHDPNSKKYGCPECGKKFRTMAEVRRHSVTHTGEKKYVCPLATCGRSFTTKSYLDKHIQSHKTNQSFQCTMKGCGQAFFMKSELIAHVKEAHPEMVGGKNGAFCCPYEGCLKVFEYPCLLYRHCTAQHTQNDFVCGYDDCLQTFDREETLWDHLLQVHGVSKEKYQEERIECPKCGVVVLKRKLQQHIRTAHMAQPVCLREDGSVIIDKDRRWFQCN